MQRHYFANKDPSSQGYGFSSGHVRMWELDCEEGWALKNWCFWTVVLVKTLECPLDCKEIQPVYSEGDQPWDFFGRNDAKAETPVLSLPHAKSWLTGKDSDAGRDWGQEDSACNVGDSDSVPGLGRSPGEGKGYPLQYSGLENSMDYIVLGIVKSQIGLSDFHFHFTICK